VFVYIVLAKLDQRMFCETIFNMYKRILIMDYVDFGVVYLIILELGVLFMFLLNLFIWEYVVKEDCNSPITFIGVSSNTTSFNWILVWDYCG